MALVVTEVMEFTNQSLHRAFELLVPIPITRIFTGSRLIPAVAGTRDEPPDWGQPGQIRKVVLQDGRTIEEELDAVDTPGYFSYTLRRFPGVLGLLAQSAKGEWWLEASSGPGEVRMRLRYSFTPRHFLAWPALWWFAQFLWKGYMRKVISNVAAYMEEEGWVGDALEAAD